MTNPLEPTITDRGFKHMPEIPGGYGGIIRTYESSAADSPHVWLRITFEGQDSVVHLAADAAWQLSEQLRYLVRNHYQGDASPDEDLED